MNLLEIGRFYSLAYLMARFGYCCARLDAEVRGGRLEFVARNGVSGYRLLPVVTSAWSSRG